MSETLQRQEIRRFDADDSSAIRTVSYAVTDQTLYVEFTNGGTALHVNVPIGIYKDMLVAKSLGGYYQNNVREAYDTVEMV